MPNTLKTTAYEHGLDAFGFYHPTAAMRDAGLAAQRRLLKRRHVSLRPSRRHAVRSPPRPPPAPGYLLKKRTSPVGLREWHGLSSTPLPPRKNSTFAANTGLGFMVVTEKLASCPISRPGKRRSLRQSFHATDLARQELQGSHFATGTDNRDRVFDAQSAHACRTRSQNLRCARCAGA